jgi:hypothetical protein
LPDVQSEDVHNREPLKSRTFIEIHLEKEHLAARCEICFLTCLTVVCCCAGRGRRTVGVWLVDFGGSANTCRKDSLAFRTGVHPECIWQAVILKPVSPFYFSFSAIFFLKGGSSY